MGSRPVFWLAQSGAFNVQLYAEKDKCILVKASQFIGHKAIWSDVLCSKQITMRSFIRRVPTNGLIFGLYLIIVAFAFFAWRNAF